MGLDMFLANKSGHEVGYWCKANHIHKWFVDNVQSGVDDCGKYLVSRENIIALRNKCIEVLENKCDSDAILPTTSGFFFGSTEYDDGYFEDCLATIEICDKCLKSPSDETFYYQSSW